MRRITVRIIAPAAVVTGVAGIAALSTSGLQSVTPPPISRPSPMSAPTAAAPSPAAPSPAAPTSPALPGSSESSSGAPLGLLRIDFDFERQPRAASNQFVIWIETSDGDYVRTIFVTSWIGHGGWRRRPMSMPVWRDASNWANATQAQIEDAARPAPSTGHHTLYWDGLDRSGVPVPAGNYVVRVEGNLYWEQMVTFEAPITVGESERSANAIPTRNDSPLNPMISNVTFAWLPGEELNPDTTVSYTRGS